MQLEEDRLLLTLPSSKTDPFHKGVTITLSASRDAAWPVTAMRHHYELCPSWNPLAPLFGRPPGDGPGSEPFTREYLVQHLRKLLGQLGVRGAYSGHSFRWGSATSANAAGLANNKIQLLGRWSSNAYQAYIDYHPEQVFQIARRFQNSPEHSPSHPLHIIWGLLLRLGESRWSGGHSDGPCSPQAAPLFYPSFTVSFWSELVMVPAWAWSFVYEKVRSTYNGKSESTRWSSVTEG